MKKILLVAGARPNFMKIAPVMAELDKQGEFSSVLVHTGQHYDREMSELFFEDLEIPRPNYNLGVGSASHAQQTAKIMQEFESVLLDEDPVAVLVVGDVNSTVACALVSAKLGYPVGHIEAGLRSFDRTMPEEINRIVTDHLSSFLFVTEKGGLENLRKEGIAKEKIFFVGNVMIDTLLRNIKKAKIKDILERLSLKPCEYALLTIHRPSNVDKRDDLREVLDLLDKLQQKILLVLPLHPRTQSKIEKFGFSQRVQAMKNLLILPPQGYLEFLNLMQNARFVLTDSGGIQEETTALGIPCLTMRENTERPSTITEGTNTLVGRDEGLILSTVDKILSGDLQTENLVPDLWDGKAAQRIVDILQEKL